MNARTRTLLGFTLLLLIVLGWSHGNKSPLRPPSDHSLHAPLQVTLDWEGRPGLNRTVTLSVQIVPEEDAESLTLQWALPAGVTMNGPTKEPLGSAAADQVIDRQWDITFDQTGTFKIAVGAQMSTADPAVLYGDADVAYFTIRRWPGRSSVSRRGPRITSTRERIAIPDVTYSVSADPNGGYWIQGRFMFLDLPIDPVSGPGTKTLVPARQILVEVWEDDTCFDDHEGDTYTDDNGIFRFWISDNDDGWLGGDKETYLEFYPETSGGYVTDISWIDEKYCVRTDNATGGSDIDFGTMAPSTYDPMFNISDALLDGWTYAKQYRTAPDQVQARYEPGYGEDGSSYNSFWNEITMADSGGDADAYDDAVILHEYGHYIADQHACDDSSGGAHNVYKHYDDDLAWSEGWASYLSSAVRNNSRYIDVNDAGGWSSYNWETWAVTGSNNEGAVCATLWDLYDPANETHDRLAGYGHNVWYVFDALMEEQWYNDALEDCDIYVFWDDWNGAGYPDDSELAAIFGHHKTAGQTTGRPIRAEAWARPYAGRPLAAQGNVDGATYPPEGTAAHPGQARPDKIVKGGLPWNAVLFLVDATNSMQGEISAVRQIIQNKVTDMDAEPYPYEYTVETFQDTGSNRSVVDHFFPDVVNPPVGNITVGGGGDPAEDSFAALSRGTANRPGYDAWLFTDAAPKYQVSTMQLRSLLQSRQITPYFFIFGDCSGGNALGSGLEEEPFVPHRAAPSVVHGPRFAPAGLEECIEPYLLVSEGANGQFFFIDAGQTNDAAEIVRALMSNNAGSGRYASYVSSAWSYMWEDTAYDWYDATGGTSYNTNNYVAVELTEPFTIYNSPQEVVYIAAPGYASFSPIGSVVRDNTAIPTTAQPNYAVYAFWDDISTYNVPDKVGAPTQGSALYTDLDVANNRFAIEWYQAYHSSAPANRETFEVLLDYDTGEIILQYNQVTDDASCTVGIENASGTVATQIAYNNPGALQPGRAIRLIPTPPQPSRDHEVLVDSTMEGVVLLLNGYSGAVSMTVLRPNGTPVDPNDPDVTYLNVGKVHYYRISNPAPGTWTARVSGDGTYYFTSSATSPLKADLLGDLTLGAAVVNPIVVNLGMTVTNATFSLVHPDGVFFDYLDLYDDGAHGDGAAGDGVYGGSYQPPHPGMFYLQVEGQTLGGEDFRRSGMVPLHFHEVRTEAPAQASRFGQPGETLVYSFAVHNDTPEAQMLFLEVDSPRGWAPPPFPELVMVPANSSLNIPVTVTIPFTVENVLEQTTLTAQGPGGFDNATVSTTVRGPVATVYLEAHPDRIAPNGRQATIVAYVGDDKEWGVADGTLVTFQTTLGTVDPASGGTIDGIITTTLTSGAATGIAEVEVTAGGVTEMIPVEISDAPAYNLTLTAADSQLPPDGNSTTLLTAHVYDKYGGPAPDGTPVCFGVEGDDMDMGSIEGQEAYTATTSGGMATATFRSGTMFGMARLRAQISLDGTGGGGEGTAGRRWATTAIRLISGDHEIYLPIILRGSQ